MPAKEFKTGMVAWIPIIFLALGSTSAKDNQHAIARHFIHRRFALASVSSGERYGLVELERDGVVKEARWNNNGRGFTLDTDPKERDAGLTSSGGILTAEGDDAVGSSGKSSLGTKVRSASKSTLLDTITARHNDVEDPKTSRESGRTTEERVIYENPVSSSFVAENYGRQKRGAKLRQRITDDRVHFPESSAESRLSSRRRPPNSSAAAGIGGNQSGNRKKEEDDVVDTYFLSNAPTNCPDGYQIQKGRCRAIRA